MTRSAMVMGVALLAGVGLACGGSGGSDAGGGAGGGGGKGGGGGAGGGAGAGGGGGSQDGAQESAPDSPGAESGADKSADVVIGDGAGGDGAGGDGAGGDGAGGDGPTEAGSSCTLLPPQMGCSGGNACYVEPKGTPMCKTEGAFSLGGPCGKTQNKCKGGYYCTPELGICCPFCSPSDVGKRGKPVCPDDGHICCMRGDLPSDTALCYATGGACPMI